MNKGGSTGGGSYSPGPVFMDKGGSYSPGPVFMNKGGSTGGGSYSQGPAPYQPEKQVAPGYYGASSAASLPSGSSNGYPSLPDSSQGNLMDPHPLLLVIFNLYWHHSIFTLSV